MGRIVRVSAGQNILAAGGKMQFPLDFLPAGYRIDTLVVEADINCDVPVAGVTSEQQTLLLDALECERRLRTSGIGVNAGDWLVNGKDVVRPAALANGAGQAIKLFWPLTFRDPRSIEPHDSAPATEFYKGRNLDVVLKKAADLVAGWVVNSGTVQVVAYLSKRPEGVVPASILTGYIEVIGKEVKLPRGHLVDLFLVKNDGSNFTEAELGNMQLTRDSVENLIEKARTTQLARMFNYFTAKGSQVQGAGIPGECLPNDGSLPWVPLHTQVPPFKATKLHAAREGFTFTFDGTLAANVARAFYRIVEPQDEVATVKAAAKLGIHVTADTVIEPKTASKSGVPGSAAFKTIAGIMSRRFKRPSQG